MMITPRKRFVFLALGSILTLLSGACKKGASHESADSLKPATEVTASSGPVRLTLRLLSTQISIGEPLWYELELRNIGSERVVLSKRPFLDPWHVARGTGLNAETSIEVFDSSGSRISPDTYRAYGPGRFDYVYEGDQKTEEKAAQEAEALVKRWEKEGLSDSEIQRKLDKFSDEVFGKAEDEQAIQEMTVLHPGDSIRSRHWFYDHEVRRRRGWTPPPGSRNYAELAVFQFPEPGRYRIRAVYEVGLTPKLESAGIDRGGIEELKRRMPEKKALLDRLSVKMSEDSGDNLVVRTEWIDVQVR